MKTVTSLLARLLLLSLGTAPAAAWAAVSCTGGDAEEVSLPASITVQPTDTPGSVMSAWTTATGLRQFHCTWIGAPTSIVEARLTQIGGLRVTDTLVVHPDDSRYRVQVYETNVAGVGLAIVALGSRSTATGFTEVGLGEGTGYVGMQLVSCTAACTPNPNDLGVRPRFAFVRLPGPVGQGTIDVQGVLTRVTTSGLDYTGPQRTHEVGIVGTTQIVLPSCAVESVEVPFGRIAMSAIGANRLLREREFSVKLSGCPPVSGMDYRLSAVIPPLNAAEAILALAPGGATGLGVQVRRPGDAVMALDTAYAVPGFSGVAGDYEVPLKAQLYRMEDAVTPGTIDAQATLTISYR